MKAIPVTVTTPSGYTFTVSSIRAVARMLSGNGTQSGGFRSTISRKAVEGQVVRNNLLVG
jgi:hypothetical protein